jgi:hypothetical protein
MLPVIPDPPSSLRATPGLLASALVLCTAVVVAQGSSSVPEEAARESTPDAILSAIERLESQHDAKCHSTASRFEDFLFGTPLSAEARLAHEDAKRRVALRLWSTASRSASEGGDARIEATHIDREAAALVVPTQQEDGRIRLVLAGGIGWSNTRASHTRSEPSLPPIRSSSWGAGIRSGRSPARESRLSCRRLIS